MIEKDYMIVELYSQLDRCLHCDLEVQEVQWVPLDHLHHPCQLGLQVQAAPREDVSNNILVLKQIYTLGINIFVLN